jgi:hypothetical protein
MMNDSYVGLVVYQNKARSILERGEFIEIMNSHLDRESARSELLGTLPSFGMLIVPFQYGYSWNY